MLHQYIGNAVLIELSRGHKR